MASVALISLVAACEPAPAPPVSVSVRVATNRGRPVQGAELLLPDGAVVRSNEAGLATLVIGGRDGDSFVVRVHCPLPLRSPRRPIVVRRLAIQGGDAEHSVKCEETRRTLVVAVRAENGPDLPILYLGAEVGRTDRSGAAHIKIDTDTRERVDLMLGTTSQQMVGVHPQNPVASFEPADHDELREFPVTFTRDAKKKPRKRAPTGPQVF